MPYHLSYISQERCKQLDCSSGEKNTTVINTEESHDQQDQKPFFNLEILRQRIYLSQQCVN